MSAAPRSRDVHGILLVAALAAFAPPARAAWPHDPTVNVPVCVGVSFKGGLVAISDGAGGEILAWYQSSTGTNRVYAQRILADGTVAPGWPVNGLQMTSAIIRDQDTPAICSDGAGGAILAWNETYAAGDIDIYAQHVTAAGVPAWGTSGVGVCTLSDYQQQPTVASDGAGGAFIAWSDHRSGTSFDLYAQHLNGAGGVVSGWTAQGTAVCTVAGDQTLPRAASDGAGGFLVAWRDTRGTNTNAIYSSRLTASGGLATGWSATGFLVTGGNYAYDSGPLVVPTSSNGILCSYIDERVSASDPNVYVSDITGAGLDIGFVGGGGICTQTSAQYDLAVAPDGSGGEFLAWQDYRSGYFEIYAQHVTGSGSIAPGWPSASTALPVCTGNPGGAYLPAVVADGSGGALITWQDNRTQIRSDIYALRVTASGSVAPGWSYNGSPVCTADVSQYLPTIVSDGAEGALIAWLDGRNATLSYNDIYTQRIDRYGQLGDPSPALTAVSDVPNDQGGVVKVSWNASYLDADPAYGITDYRLWRSSPPVAAGPLSLLPATRDPDEAAATGRRLVLPAATGSLTWEYVLTQPAAGLPAYNVTAPTTSDSLPGNYPRTYFMVEARSQAYLGAPHWFSAPDSGYSVDNLPPAIPAPFTGQYASGTAKLSWGRNTEPDFALYRLYRGTSATFVPGPSNLVIAKPDTGYTDAAGAPYYYKLAAEDLHGNLSGFATLLPSGATNVGAEPVAFALGGVSPNPAGGRELDVSFSLPDGSPARLELLDVAGRRIAALDAGALGAGRHVVNLAQGGRVAPGLYLVRLTQAGQARTARAVVVN